MVMSCGPRTSLTCTGSGGSNGGCLAVYGYVGPHVAVLELLQDGSVERHAAVAPVGAAVVAAGAGTPFTVRA
jgi:hypothetical protein